LGRGGGGGIGYGIIVAAVDGHDGRRDHRHVGTQQRLEKALPRRQAAAARREGGDQRRGEVRARGEGLGHARFEDGLDVGLHLWSGLVSVVSFLFSHSFLLIFLSFHFCAFIPLFFLFPLSFLFFSFFPSVSVLLFLFFCFWGGKRKKRENTLVPLKVES